MKTRTSISFVLLAALAAVAFQTTGDQRTAVAGVFGKLLPDQTGCSRCQSCGHACKLDAESDEEDRLCLDVETKVVCIPRVVFPWQRKATSACDSCDGGGCSNCVHNGARVREVCVIKPSSYTCPTCKYTWSAEKQPVCDECCDSPRGCDVMPSAERSPEKSPTTESSEGGEATDEIGKSTDEIEKSIEPAKKNEAAPAKSEVESLKPPQSVPTAKDKPRPTFLPKIGMIPAAKW